MPQIRGLKKTAKRPPAAAEITLIMITLAGPFFLSLKMTAEPPLKKSQQTQRSKVPVTIRAGLCPLNSGC